MEACLKRWFQNPKDLNLTDPRIRYPFQFKKWLATSYSTPQVHPFILKDEHWIIGMFSLSLHLNTDNAHLFHVFIDKAYRKKGLGISILDKAVSVAKNAGVGTLTLRVFPNNKPAFHLYTGYGFQETGKITQNNIEMSLSLI